MLTRAKNVSRRFMGDERGATAIEYGLIAALVFVAAIGALTMFCPDAGDCFWLFGLFGG